jgi:hypothetical protein
MPDTTADLYPELSPEGVKAAEQLIERFKEQLKKAAASVISDLYVSIGEYIESGYDWQAIRRAMFEAYRAEIMAEMPDELRRENEELRNRLFYRGDR